MKASRMADEGFGEFERCFQIIKACKGNEEEAKKMLSQLIFKEHKKK
jgi:hypothetical protein